MKRVFWLCLVGVMLGACGNDTTKKEGPSTDCPIGESYNPILARCVQVQTPPGNGGNGTDADAGNNNNTSSDSGPDNSTDVTNPPDDDTGPTNPIPPDVCGTGTIIGVACAPSGELLAAADVTVTGIDCATGEPFELTTRTDSNGLFELENVPAGTHTLRVHTGSFESQNNVIVRADNTTDLTVSKVCVDQSVEIAVIQGNYDHVEGVLDVLNLDYTIVGNDALLDQRARTFLNDLNAMNQYDIIFINCGDLWSNLVFYGTATIIANLRAYVQGGKSLYIADWSAPFAQAAFPEMIDYLGVDTVVDDARQGYAPQTIDAAVMSPALQAALGHNTAQIAFPQDVPNGVINNNWAIAVGAGPQSTVHLQGDALLCGGGNCSTPGGTQTDAALLVTYKAPSGGTVVFTSFHNEQQVTLNQDMERILRFLIFQL